jgi:tetratricopeptide (TPR) repeat protein
MKKARANPYATTEANPTPMTQAAPRAATKSNPYLVHKYLCPNPGCRKVQVVTMPESFAVYRGQRWTCPCLQLDVFWKLLFGGLTALLIVGWLAAPFAARAIDPTVWTVAQNTIAFALIVVTGFLVFVFIHHYARSPKMRITLHRCNRCGYCWQEQSPISPALSEWAEGEKNRATKRGKKEEMAAILLTFSYLAAGQKNWSLAESYAKECLARSLEAKSDRTAAHAREHLGGIALLRGQYGEAVTQYETCLPQFRKLKEWQCLTHALGNLGLARLYQGITDGIAALFADDLSFVLKMHDTVGMSWICAGMAGLAALQDQPERAARLYGASRALCEAAGGRSLALENTPGFGQSVDATRERLGEEEYEKAWQAGYAMRLDDAMAYCVRCFRPSAVPPRSAVASRPNVGDGPVTSERKSLEELITDLGRDDATVHDAALALGRMRNANAVGPLMQALQHNSPAVREGAAIALGQIRDPRAIQPLIAALADPGDPSQEHKWNPADLAADGLISFGERAVEPVMAALQHPDPAVRYQAVSVLMELPAVPPIDSFIAALRDSDPGVRWMAAHALGQLGDICAVPALERAAYEERQADVVDEARTALSQIRSRGYSAFWQERLIEELESLRASLV